MNPFLEKVRDFGQLVRPGHVGEVGRLVRGRIYSKPIDLGLERDLAVPIQPPPPAKIEFEMRPYRADDDLSFLRQAPPGETTEAAVLRLNQLRFIAADIPTCHVGVTSGGQICYMQWLVLERDMPRMAALFGPIFPPVEALLEGAYTPATFRGKGVMGRAMTQVAETGIPLGVRRVMTFVADDNIGSLKGCKNAGFRPVLERQYTFLMFRRFVSFRSLPAGTKYSFES